jgi:hypothetical protein
MGQTFSKFLFPVKSKLKNICVVWWVGFLDAWFMGRFKSKYAEEICDRLRAGQSPQDILAAMRKVRSSQISYWNAKLGRPKFKRGTWRSLLTNPNRIKAKQLFAGGMVKSAIARELGLTRTRIGHYLSGR